MEVVHKAAPKPAPKEEKQKVIHTVAKPAVKHADPATKAHQKLIEAKLKADSASQQAANEKAKAADDDKSQRVIHHQAKKAKLQAHHDSKEASLKAIRAHEAKGRAEHAAKEAAKPEATQHAKAEAKRLEQHADKLHQEAQDAQVKAHASAAKAAQVTV